MPPSMRTLGLLCVLAGCGRADDPSLPGDTGDAEPTEPAPVDLDDEWLADVAEPLASASAPNTVVVSTAAGLKAALAAAAPGSVVYVADTASIDLTGTVGLTIPARVTLASGRGNGSVAGALLFTTRLDTMPLLVAGGEGVRVTGLRLRGPDPEIRTSAYGLPIAQGIRAVQAPNLRVDHCELSGWSHAAIYLDHSADAYVHHNSIHHNRRTGLGYGVCLNRASTALIERNAFDANRHAIAGTGIRDIRYEARFNLVGPTRNGHAFDMHGENEALDNGAPYAGDELRIHHNTFLGATLQGVVIRGRPATGAFIDHNCFAESSGSGLAVIQRYFTGNLFVSNNLYSQPSGTCHRGAGPTHSVTGDVNGDGLADLVTLAGGSAKVYFGARAGGFSPGPSSFGGTMKSGLFDGDGHTVIDVADVDGDTNADLVTVHSGGDVYVYRGLPGGGFSGGVASFHGTYPLLSAARDGFEPIAVADVNGDGLGDLVSHRAGTVYVHPGRSDGTFGGSVPSFAGTYNSGFLDGSGFFTVGVADVTGDGRADLVGAHSNGSAYVYPGLSTLAFGGGVSSFAGTMQVALLDATGFEPIGLGDVNGDHRADLVTLHSNGTVYVYLGAATGKLGPRVDVFAGTMPSSLFSGSGYEPISVLDVTGDGRADLVAAHSSGPLYVFPGTAAGGFGSAILGLGTFATTRFDRAGEEVVEEKSLLRRRGCTATGCFAPGP